MLTLQMWSLATLADMRLREICSLESMNVIDLKAV
jgi:hypothetical protein